MAICDDYLTAIDEGYDGANEWMENVQAFAEWFSEHETQYCTAEYKRMITSFAGSVHYCLRSLVYADGDYELPRKIPEFLRHCVGGGEVDPYVLDMDKILTAMWDSDKLRSFHFINYIDAMRASIWNVEIYETHLEEWYRHFSL